MFHIVSVFLNLAITALAMARAACFTVFFYDYDICFIKAQSSFYQLIAACAMSRC